LTWISAAFSGSRGPRTTWLTTPTLREVWRTAPYLYDGRALTIEEALLIKDRGVEDLTPEELSALAEYVRSL